MNRRTCLQALAAVATSAGVADLAAQTPTPRAGGMPAKAPIVLYCDLEIDQAKEQDMLKHFHSVFAPAAAKFEGYIDVKILKLRTLIQGPKPPAGINYRFQLTYQNEELRQKWVNSDTHTKVWAGIDATLKDKNFQVLLFDAV